uniref:Phytocyanin domain-containing protein n=1 Tax=Kalanchoe fedtschenkoi TaxID=63787 RepID=A0A7N0ZR07_KALFE
MATDPSMAVNLASLLLLIFASTATAYTNHTVGDAKGWHFNATTNTSATDYSAWAANQTFSLGDYLIFKTTTNQTVIQTYNVTNYRHCSADDDESDGDTFEYEGGSNNFNEELTIEVPLTIEGANYYFSGAADGIQCQQGMAFNIKVGHGQGLPPYLNQPPPPPYVTPSPPPPESTEQPSPVENDVGMTSAANVRAALCALTVLLFA